ncbi:MAG: 3-phosphoshikimate 1-carboxyvinyltransferase [Gemmatimonadaceae bacterium]
MASLIRDRLVVHGSVRVPGDKSISHRALLLAALGDGVSVVRDALDSADVRSTATVLRTLGVDVPPVGDVMRVQGLGRRGLVSPASDLDCGNSGTTARLGAGVVAGSGLTGRFVGDASLSRRPMRRIARPLEAMGARVDLPVHGGLPMTVHGGELAPVAWTSDVASAQVKSAVLMAGLIAGVGVAVREPTRSRDHTERMLRARGVDVRIDGTRVDIPPTERIAAIDAGVPADPSSAAFFAALAALADGGRLTMTDVCVNPTRTGFLCALRRMGAVVSIEDEHDQGGETVASVVVAPAPLRGITVSGEEVPSLIDELPLLACVATRAVGETLITGAAELRVKESDRITAVVSNLRAIGVDADELPDGMRIVGSRRGLRGGIRAHGDHRIAMAFGILGALPDVELEIDDTECVGVSYPAFWRDLARLASA